MSQAMPTQPTSRNHTMDRKALGDPAVRRVVEKFVRRRVPPSDVEDVVQTVFCDALAAADRPVETTELTRWLLGIARHKVVDRHRRALREPPAELPEIPAGPAPIEARALVRWAEQQAGDRGEARKTLDWMAREGEGEKLDAIAEEERVPAARVRQRVSRMRRWMKERWAAELAAVAMLAILALAAWWLLHDPAPPEAHDAPLPGIVPEAPNPLDRARALRADALRACDRGDWATCLDGLDAAKALDPDGDRAPAVEGARAGARRAIPRAIPPKTQKDDAPAPPPQSPSPPPAPSATNAPPSFLKPAPKSVRRKPSSEPFEDVGTPVDGAKSGGSERSGRVKKRAATKVLDATSWGS
jgi:DNA-directed RNA polymerase specialized sigma24 family protein